MMQSKIRYLLYTYLYVERMKRKIKHQNMIVVNSYFRLDIRYMFILDNDEAKTIYPTNISYCHVFRNN